MATRNRMTPMTLTWETWAIVAITLALVLGFAAYVAFAPLR